MFLKAAESCKLGYTAKFQVNPFKLKPGKWDDTEDDTETNDTKNHLLLKTLHISTQKLC